MRSKIIFQIRKATKGGNKQTVDAAVIEKLLRDNHKGRIFEEGYEFLINPSGIPCKMKVKEILVGDEVATETQEQREREAIPAFFTEKTTVITEQEPSGNIDVIGGASAENKQIFRHGFDPSQMDVGGLGPEFKEIFQNAFASRMLPPKQVQEMGLPHVRGMVLYGPPGCGKTLIARQLGKALNAHQPKVINGPEILNKYVGQSEENIRELFKDAEEEQEAKKENSSLHIIIFDEIDAICKQRGTVGGGTGVHDSVVNQLLSKMDGVHSLDNILVIGMTNRLDMLDSALLRPGRFEVKVEISLPNTDGRKEILEIHTRKLFKSGVMDRNSINLEEIADKTKNFTGAELEGLVRRARSAALGEVLSPKTGTFEVDEHGKKKELKIFQRHFIEAINKMEPQFGAKEDQLKGLYEQHGITEFGKSFEEFKSTLNQALNRVKKEDSHSSIISTCIYGAQGSGKTAYTAAFADRSQLSYVKRIGADSLVGMTEQQKIQAITTVFKDAYRSTNSLIILDDVERLIGKLFVISVFPNGLYYRYRCFMCCAEYVRVGHTVQFSNGLLQLLMVLVNQKPPHKSKENEALRTTTAELSSMRHLMVIATTSQPEVLESTGLMQCFDIRANIPTPQNKGEFKTLLDTYSEELNIDVNKVAGRLARLGKQLPIKKLMLACELFLAKSDQSSAAENEQGEIVSNPDDAEQRFMEVINKLGVQEQWQGIRPDDQLAGLEKQRTTNW